jgi:RNA polymerase-binding transcription factor DksA/DNA-binding NarL/FixJ family response regulator
MSVGDSVSVTDRVRVLVVSGYEADHAALRRIFGRWWRLEKAVRCRDAREYLGNSNRAAVVICERRLPDGNWKDVLGTLDDKPVAPNLIVVSKSPDDALWAEALNLGAWDVLAKPFVTEEARRVAYSAWLNWNSRLEKQSAKDRMARFRDRGSAGGDKRVERESGPPGLGLHWADGYEALLLKKRKELMALLRLDQTGSLQSERVAEDDQPTLLHDQFVSVRVNNLNYRQLTLVEEALARIERGEFGNCAGCGAKISPRRLRAMPWADLCVECAERDGFGDGQEDAREDWRVSPKNGRFRGVGINGDD